MSVHPLFLEKFCRRRKAVRVECVAFWVLNGDKFFAKVFSETGESWRKFAMKRKEKSLLAAAVITLILSGCGSDTLSTSETKDSAPAEGEASAAEDEAPEPEEETPAAENGTFTEEASAEEGEDFVTADELVSVGVINSDPGESGYHLAVDGEMKAVFTEENGYSASFVYHEKTDEQLAAAKQFIQDGVDYLLLSVSDAADWSSVLMDAQDAGIPVILFDRIIGVDESLYEAAVISDAEKEGEAAVAWLKEQGLSEYNIVHLQGIMGSEEQKGRTGALDAQVKADGKWKLVARRTAEWSEDKAQEIVQSVIESGEPFNVIYAENDDMAKGAVAALDEAGISHGVDGEIMVISFGGNKWALEELLLQNWNYDGQCSPFQASYIDSVIKTIESGGILAEKNIVMDEKGFDADIITAEDIELYGI